MIRLVPRTNVSSRFASVPCAVLYSDLVWLLSLDRITDCPISSISLQQQLFPGSLLNQFETHPSAASHPANPNPGSLRLKSVAQGLLNIMDSRPLVLRNHLNAIPGIAIDGLDDNLTGLGVRTNIAGQLGQAVNNPGCSSR